MTSLGLGDVGRFPFVDAPDPRQVADGVRLLEELQAFDTDDGAGEQPVESSQQARQGTRRGRGRGRQLTPYGRSLARLPVDPRLGRMLLEAGKLGDVIAVPGDPSREINVVEKVFFVMKDGTVYRNDVR